MAARRSYIDSFLGAVVLTAAACSTLTPQKDPTRYFALEAVAQSACRSRQEAAQLMAGYIPEAEVVQFLLAGLRRRRG